jgi:Ni,Fe-hydrogenase I large subunit
MAATKDKSVPDTQEKSVPDTQEKSVYMALDAIRHNGKAYEVGELLNDITEKEAATLLNLGVIKVDSQPIETEQP